MQKTEKKKRKSADKLKTRIAIFIISLITISLMTLTCIVISMVLVWSNSNLLCFGSPFPSNQDVENRLYFKFPSSSKEINYSAEHARDNCLRWVKFDMNPDDLEEFQKSTLVEHYILQTQPDPRYIRLSEQIGWDQPLSPIVGQTEKQLKIFYTTQYIVIDISNPSRYTAYIITTEIFYN